jgi:very-short-patch-repair endonuclease
MSVERTPLPSPLAGEGGRERSERPGEGGFSPSPASLTRRVRSAPSPARGEGTDSRRSVPKGGPVKRARELRIRMTDAERKLWFALRDRRFAKFKFRRQVPIGPFIADFVCFEARLVIEIDGGQHAESLSDKRRDRWFVTSRFRVFRFWNNDVLSNLEGVATVIAEALALEQRR